MLRPCFTTTPNPTPTDQHINLQPINLSTYPPPTYQHINLSTIPMSTLVICIIVVATALLAVALTGLLFYLVVKKYFDNEQKVRLLEMRIEEHKESLRVVSPIRLQAYERMALFLERISPNSLVLRCYRPGMDMPTLQSEMTRSIRDEWEHNLSQQVYISSEAWRLIRQAKDEMMGVINSAAITIPEDADPTRLASAIFATVAEGQLPTATALEFLKQEMRDL